MRHTTVPTRHFDLLLTVTSFTSLFFCLQPLDGVTWRKMLQEKSWAQRTITITNKTRKD